MKRVAAVWEFIAGESRLAPVGVAVGILAALVLLRMIPQLGALVGLGYAGIIALALWVGVFERAP